MVQMVSRLLPLLQPTFLRWPLMQQEQAKSPLLVLPLLEATRLFLFLHWVRRLLLGRNPELA
jgi:hypothetical protein